MSVEIVTAVANAIAEGSKAYHEWLKGRDRRRMEIAIDAGEQYILTTESDLEPKKKEKLLKHYRKRFFAYN